MYNNNVKNFIATRREKLEKFIKKNIVYVTPTMLFGGFIIHILTFRSIDEVFENLVLIFYLLVVGVCIALLVGRDRPIGRYLKVVEREFTVTAIMLFSFGSLFSAFLIFYSQSGSFISSWPFILILLILTLGPELRKRYFYKKMLLQFSIFYVAIFCYLIFLIPIILKKMGPEIYLLSGLVSLLIIGLYIFLLRKIDPREIYFRRKKILIRVFSIFAIFNILYFANVIPPIPLALKFRAVYHDFSRIQGIQYHGFYEKAPVWQFWNIRKKIFHRVGNETVYVYSQIYAPVNLNTNMYHRWEYFDPSKTRWVETDSIKIPITGGRAGGYRGFSQKTNVWPGSWRVKIETSRGQTLGRLTFKIKESESKPELSEDIFK